MRLSLLVLFNPFFALWRRHQPVLPGSRRLVPGAAPGAAHAAVLGHAADVHQVPIRTKITWEIVYSNKNTKGVLLVQVEQAPVLPVRRHPSLPVGPPDGGGGGGVVHDPDGRPGQRAAPGADADADHGAEPGEELLPIKKGGKTSFEIEQEAPGWEKLREGIRARR